MGRFELHFGWGGPRFIASFIWEEFNMQNAGSHELGHANTALMLGLFDVLANKGVLTRSDLNTIMVDAISKLEPMRNIGTINGAIELIETLFPRIHGSD